MIEPQLLNDMQELIDRYKCTISDIVTQDTLVNGPVYLRYNKMLAWLYLKTGYDLEAIYHLTESHAPTLRNTALDLFAINDQMPNKTQKHKNSNLNLHYLSFKGAYFEKGAAGVLERLKELPSEWTIVQMTFQFDDTETCYSSYDEIATKMHPLHITRLPCGELLTRNRSPVTVLVDEPSSVSDNMPTILHTIRSVQKDFSRRGTNVEKHTRRKKADEQLKSVTGEIFSGWIKEWACLLVGRIKETELENLVVSTIDSSLNNHAKSCKSRKVKPDTVTEKTRSILYQVADCCAHMSELNINKAVGFCVNDKKCAASLVTSILNLKKEQTHRLMIAERHPVILILDDTLDCVPWEITPLFYKHPVSRMPSLHIIHAVYDKHKDYMVNGIRIVDETETGFYLINPDKDLLTSEKNLLSFLQSRRPSWFGITGTKMSEEDLLSGLTKENVFLYCGHGNGSQFMRSEVLQKVDLTAIPLLFGCSSVAKRKIGEGGLPELWGVSHHFLLAGCPCMFGMLWSVTNVDTDMLTMVFLNTCLPGSPIDINDLMESEIVESDMETTEPELLRAMRRSRLCAKRFMNGAAFIARGIPVAFKH